MASSPAALGKTPGRSSVSTEPSAAVMGTYGRQNIVFARGEGCWLFAENGDRYLDFGSGVAVNALGHAHPALVAALKQADTRRSERFVTDLDQALRDQAQFGFVTAFGSWHSYINAVGVTFHPTDGSPAVALTCGGIVDILPEDHCRKVVGPRLVALVEQMRERLAGGEGSRIDKAR